MLYIYYLTDASTLIDLYQYMGREDFTADNEADYIMDENDDNNNHNGSDDYDNDDDEAAAAPWTRYVLLSYVYSITDVSKMIFCSFFWSGWRDF